MQSLSTEAGETSLQNRHLKLTLQYAIKLEANQNNPAYQYFKWLIFIYMKPDLNISDSFVYRLNHI